MEQSSEHRTEFDAEVADRFGILPNFFRSAQGAPDLIPKLWAFAKAGYLDNPIPALFKERLFVTLSRLCPARYCIVRHVGFLLGHGRPAGDADAPTQSIADVVQLLKRATPWNRDMAEVYARLNELTEPLTGWPEPETEMEDMLFACATVVFSEPARGEEARLALLRVLGPRNFEYLSGCLAFIRTAHYWTMLHPEIETEEDMRILMRDHAELARLLIEDPEADRCEMGARLFDELAALRELNEREELRKAKEALEEKDRQKDHFIAILAHELRNPMAAIRSAADALGRMKLDDPKVERLHQRLDRQSIVMARVLDDLLDTARITSGKTAIRFESVDLRDVLREMVEENEERVSAAGIGFECEISNTPCPIRGDRVRLRQVIDNLFSNAVKFTPAPGRVTVRLSAEGGSAIFRIEDTGIGFDRASAGSLFEPFIQQEQQNGANEGLGLGLTISRRLAELQGGSLRGQSPGPGGGSTFTLELPLAAPSEIAEPRAEQPRDRERRRVLLIDDNRDVAESLSELIGDMGFDVDVAYDGRSALACAELTPPDVVICDLGLPGGMDGCAVARAMRADPRLRDVIMIALSGYSQAKDHEETKRAGFDRLVAKPITAESLEALLRGTFAQATG
jgi:signal transduction histidine kinase/ActR/RegA family two-component response regulator